MVYCLAIGFMSAIALDLGGTKSASAVFPSMDVILYRNAHLAPNGGVGRL